MESRPASHLSDEQVRDAPALFKAAFEHTTDPIRELVAAGSEVAKRIAAHVRTTEPDRRVRQIIKWANENLDGALAMSDAAEAVGLSPSRASHLFVEETGLPFRTYVLWLRLVRAVDAHTQGANLTEAAQQAGFLGFRASQSHIQADVRVARRSPGNVVAVPFKRLMGRGAR